MKYVGVPGVGGGLMCVDSVYSECVLLGAPHAGYPGGLCVVLPLVRRHYTPHCNAYNQVTIVTSTQKMRSSPGPTGTAVIGKCCLRGHLGWHLIQYVISGRS